MLIAGVINIPNLIFFSSDNYNGWGDGLALLSLKASAVCTDSTWAPCPTCKKEDWDDFPPTYDRYAEATAQDGTLLTFIKTNNCGMNNGVGLVAFACLLYVCLSIYILAKTTKRQEIKFDNASLTTTDFAVEVSNPPKDARDPEEWRSFFEQFGHVTSITVTLDNEDLIWALMKRRELVVALKNLQPPGVDVDIHNVGPAVETAWPLTRLQKLMFMSNAETLKTNIDAIDETISTDLSKRHYDVSHVFVIFEKEASQQEALHQMSVGGFHVLANNTWALADNFTFRGEHVLAVQEPPEPSSVRWQDLDEGIFHKLFLRSVTSVLTLIAVIASNVIVVRVRNQYGIAYAAIAISTFNSVFPSVCNVITNLESHASEGSKQASLYVKITCGLWFVTSILTGFVTPFTETLESFNSALIPAMYAIFITELLKTPVTQILDIPGNVYRHILAPRAPDQRRMNAYFTGVEYQLSERYTVS